VEVKRRAILAQRAGLGPCSNIPELPPLVASGARVARLGVVVADAGFDSEEKHRFVREVIGAVSVIPARRGRPMREPRGYRGLMAISLSRGGSTACATWQVTVISVMKRKLGDLAPGHTIHMQCKQALLAGLTYNLYLLKYELSWRLPTLRPAS
jgi:hypothetical protein